jgi:hypothetical protein
MAMVRRRNVFMQSALLGVLVLSLWVGSATAAVQAGTGSTASGSQKYTVHQVLRGFKSVGLALYDATCGPVVEGCFLGTPVVTLQTAKPQKGWTAAIYVYQSTTLAGQSFRASAKRWRASGIAATALKNILVTVSPNGHTSSGKGHSFAMPQEIVKALAAVSGSH